MYELKVCKGLDEYSIELRIKKYYLKKLNMLVVNVIVLWMELMLYKLWYVNDFFFVEIWVLYLVFFVKGLCVEMF